MPVLVHAPHPGISGASPTHEPAEHDPHESRQRWFFPALVAAVVLVVFLATGIALSFTHAPHDTALDARIAAFQRERARRARAQTPAGVADRILSGEGGRRMQQQLLDEPVK